MKTRCEALIRPLGEPAPRRRVLSGLGAFGLGSLGIAGLTPVAEAKSCRKRCKDHCGPNTSKRKCRKKCQRKCNK